MVSNEEPLNWTINHFKHRLHPNYPYVIAEGDSMEVDTVSIKLDIWIWWNFQKSYIKQFKKPLKDSRDLMKSTTNTNKKN